MFYLNASYSRRRVCYYRQLAGDVSKHMFVNCDSAPCYRVECANSDRIKTDIRIIDKDVNVNSY